MNGSPQTNRGPFTSYRMGIKGGIFSLPEHDVWPLIRSLPATKTLLVNIGLGTLGFGQFPGQAFHVHDWPNLMDLAVIVGGGNPSLKADLPFSPQHHDSVLRTMGGTDPMEGVETIMIHGWGIRTILEWHCLGLHAWTGKEETTEFQRFQTGQLIGFMRQIFRASLRGIHVWITFPLRHPNEMAGSNNRPLPDLPGDVIHEMMCLSDLVLSMEEIWNCGTPETTLITAHNNSWGYPAKSSKAFGLDPLEPADLLALTNKVMGEVHHSGPMAWSLAEARAG